MTDGGHPPTAFFVRGVWYGVVSPPTHIIDFQDVKGGGCATSYLHKGDIFGNVLQAIVTLGWWVGYE
jgi:hypothetical protein